MADLNVVKISSDDTEFVYKLYCQNNSFIDPYISEFPILNANRHLCSQEFIDILNNDNTYSLICNKKKEIKNKGFESYFLDEKVGFLCYEKQEKNIEIVFIEAKDCSVEIYDKLIKSLIDRVGQGTLYKNFVIKMEEDKQKLIECLCHNKFVETKMIVSKNGPDIYYFERKL